MQAPLADREPVEHVIHGDRRMDHYAWMKNKKDPRVRAYLEAENTYADTEMKDTEQFQEKLYQEMLGRIQQTDLSVPYRLRGYEYYTRTEQGKQYPIYCRRKWTASETPADDAPAHTPEHEHWGEDSVMQELRAELRKEFAEDFQRREGRITEISVEATTAAPLGESESTNAGPQEEILLDLNALAVGHAYMGLGIFEVSDDDRWLAYATDTTGFRQYALEVKDLAVPSIASQPQPHKFRAERVTSAAWAMDNRTLFYATEDEVTKRSNQLWRHNFPDPADPAPHDSIDELLYEEKDERFRIDVERSRSGAYLFLVINSHTTSEARYLRADSPFGRFELLAEREDEHEYYVDHHPGNSSDPAGGVFFIRTNSGGRTYRVVTAPTSDPAQSRWREVIPNRPRVMVAGLEATPTSSSPNAKTACPTCASSI